MLEKRPYYRSVVYVPILRYITNRSAPSIRNFRYHRFLKKGFFQQLVMASGMRNGSSSKNIVLAFLSSTKFDQSLFFLLDETICNKTYFRKSRQKRSILFFRKEGLLTHAFKWEIFCLQQYKKRILPLLLSHSQENRIVWIKCTANPNTYLNTFEFDGIQKNPIDR